MIAEPVPPMKDRDESGCSAGDGIRDRNRILPLAGELYQLYCGRISTAELNRWLEGKIRDRPDHWLWIHRRWKVGGVV